MLQEGSFPVLVFFSFLFLYFGLKGKLNFAGTSLGIRHFPVIILQTIRAADHEVGTQLCKQSHVTLAQK